SAVVLLGVQGAVFAGRVAQHDVEHGPRCVTQLAVTGNDRTGTGLILLANGAVGFLEEAGRIGRCDFGTGFGTRIWLPFEELAASTAVARYLVSAQNQGRHRVARVGNATYVPPGVRRIAGVDANAVAVHAADRLVGRVLARATIVAK